MSEFEPTGADVRFEGHIIRAGVERFRYADGEEVSREKVWHPGAVGILADRLRGSICGGRSRHWPLRALGSLPMSGVWSSRPS